MKPLTIAQEQLLAYVERFHAESGRGPSVRIAAASLGIVSPSLMHRRITRLIELGYLKKTPDGLVPTKAA